MKKNVDFVEKARQMRVSVLEAVHSAGKGHIGGAFSIIEILVSLFHAHTLKFDAQNPTMESRDRFLLSKGHASVGLYAVLADLGYFPSEELSFLNQGRLLGEHPDPRIPGIEFISGSLGHGLPVAGGMALADKLDKKRGRKTVVLMGDGECYEGSVWEAACFCSHHELNNLCAIVDRNRLITHGTTEQFNRLEPLADKWDAFGWSVHEVDAHSFYELSRVWQTAFNNENQRPTMVIANSIKGKGVSFMENNESWHHGGVDEQRYQQALKELLS